MRRRISKEFAFEAAHHLSSLPEGHKCKRPHGHSYRVQVVLESTELNEHGFILDYGEMKPFGDLIAARLDRRGLNEVFEGLPTTAELIAQTLFVWAYDLFSDLVYSVRVSETAKTWAEVFRE